MRRVTLFAVKRPGWLPSITRPSPELFGLIEATSNAGTDGLLCGACARRRGGSAGAKPPGSSPSCGAKQELCARFLNEAHNGLGAPRARPPERSGATGPPRAEAWGAAGAKPPDLARHAARNKNFV